MARAKILVVEDQAMIALDIQAQLIQLDYDVAGICVTGAEAVKRAAELKVDLVLTDVLLAGRTDGIEAARQIRALHNIPVIFLTAHSDTATVDRAKQAEPYGYIVKPFNLRTLNTTMEIALHNHKMECSR
jgi:CheY-like chemotaxis protein